MDGSKSRSNTPKVNRKWGKEGGGQSRSMSYGQSQIGVSENEVKSPSASQFHTSREVFLQLVGLSPNKNRLVDRILRASAVLTTPNRKDADMGGKNDVVTILVKNSHLEVATSSTKSSW